MSRGADTRAAILRHAVEVACLRGFDGLNLQPLADRAGLTKSGLYAHFGSKQALQLATLGRAAELFQQTVVLPAKTEPAGLARVEGVFERWLRWPGIAGLPGNCPFFAAVQELDDADGPVRDRLVRLFREFQQVLEQLIASAVRRGHLRAGTDPTQFAHELLALRLAHHWGVGFMHDPGAPGRTRIAYARLIGRTRPP